jgi:hypothetical protein
VADLGHEPAIDPPDVYDRRESIDCPGCDRQLELGYDVSEGEDCPGCGTTIDGDTIRDQLDAQHEPPEWG